MERKEFMKSIGAGAAFAVTFGCLGGCLREEIDPLSPTDSLAETIPEITPKDSIAETLPETTPTDSTATVTETTPETIPETTETVAETTPEPESTPEPEPTPEPTPEPDPTPPSNALFTIDLKSSEASKLAKKGGYIIKNKIVVAKNLEGNYVAATVICSHDLLKKMVFKNNEYYCTAHAARFDQSGKGLNSKGKRGLKIYKTSINGNALSILA